MPRYSERPYGLKPAARAKVSCRTHSRLVQPRRRPRDRFGSYERDGKRHPALFHKGQWMRVVQFPRDSHTGQVRVAMDGTTVSNPDCLGSS